MVGLNLNTISRISPDGIYYGDGYRLTISFADELRFLLYQLHIPRKRRSKTVEVSFCGIVIEHHMPEWYDI